MRHLTSAPQPVVARILANQATPMIASVSGSGCFLLTLVLVTLLLLWPGMIGAEGPTLNLPSTPIHLEATSVDSVTARVDLGDPITSLFSSQAKWKGYIDFLGKPGTERSLGQPDLFIPFLQDTNDMTFFNIRGQFQFDNTDNSESNIGLGHRHMFQDWILGGYGYYDRRNTQYGSHVNQFTGGVELMSVDWAFRMNGYLPENQTTTFTGNANVSVLTPGDQIQVQIDGVVQEKALPGLDGEVGYLLPIPWKAYKAVFDETRVYAGGYHFIGDGNFDSITGPRGRLELRAYDLPVLGPGSRFMMGVEAQWDEPRGSQAFGLASLRIPFDVFSDKSKRKGLKGLDRRMLQPVIRDIDVVTSEYNVPTEITPALNQAGHAYTQVVEVDAADEVILQAAIDANTAGTPLIIPKTNGGEISLTGSLTLHTNQTLVGENGTVGYQSQWLGAGTVEYAPGGAAKGFLASGGFAGDRLIAMEADSEVNGLTLDANGNSTNGLRIWTVAGGGSDAAGTRYVANMKVMNTNNDVLLARGSGAVFRIDRSRFTDSQGGGADGSGVEAFRGGTIYISNSYVANNGGHGLNADGNGGLPGTIYADHMLIENNGQTGADANGHVDSLIRITDSTIRGNAAGMLANNGADIIGERLQITGSHNGLLITNNSTMTLTDSTIANNTNDGVRILGGTLVGERLQITGNDDGIEMIGGTTNIIGSTIANNWDDGVKNFGGTLTIDGSLITNNGDVGVHSLSEGSYGDPPVTTVLSNVTILGNGWNVGSEDFEGGYAVASTGDSTVNIWPIAEGFIEGPLTPLCDTNPDGGGTPSYIIGTINVEGVPVPGSGGSCD